MSVEVHYKTLADRLLANYTEQIVSIPTSKFREFLSSLTPHDRKFLNNIAHHSTIAYTYQVPADLDAALDTIDLSKVYEGVDKREQEQKEKKSSSEPLLGYEDFVVLELLDYFKNSFFTWVNKPKCPTCDSDENVQATGISQGPAGLGFTDEVVRIEEYKCTGCGNNNITFPRLNNPVSLLQTRSGRCGEWVNCFMLILQAVLGSEAQIRYVWNFEDHVWCEYYSANLKRWVHLDPCEACFDKPNLYCDNWGKSMSWVFGFGLGYCVDLSDKYITNPEKQISKTTMVSNVSVVRKFLDFVNNQLVKKYYSERLIDVTGAREKLLKLYTDVILLKNIEQLNLHKKELPTKTSVEVDAIVGRQSGSAEWTKSRGEAGDK